jgi:predicted HAD superfamily Cof-like phosphohydrolase
LAFRAGLACSMRGMFASISVVELANELSKLADGTKDIFLCRAATALDELSEWLEANATFNVVTSADAIGDRLYLLLGDSVATGLPLDEIFQAVHRSNMSKMSGVQTGVGKAAKGPGDRRPAIAEILARLS